MTQHHFKFKKQGPTIVVSFGGITLGKIVKHTKDRWRPLLPGKPTYFGTRELAAQHLKDNYQGGNKKGKDVKRNIDTSV